MIERAEREKRVTDLVIAAVTCDRCGQPARHMNGIGVPMGYAFEGVYIKGSLYPSASSADTIRMAWQLCGACTVDLQEWIGSEGDPSEGLAAQREP